MSERFKSKKTVETVEEWRFSAIEVLDALRARFERIKPGLPRTVGECEIVIDANGYDPTVLSYHETVGDLVVRRTTKSEER